MTSKHAWFTYGQDHNGGGRDILYDSQVVRDDVLSSDAVALVEAFNAILAVERTRYEVLMEVTRDLAIYAGQVLPPDKSTWLLELRRDALAVLGELK